MPRLSLLLIFLTILLFPLNSEGRNDGTSDRRDGGSEIPENNRDGGREQGRSDEIIIAVPWFSQIEVWGELYLGDSSSIKLRTHGCALCCTAMVFNSYGIMTNPEKLNQTLLENNAFEKGWDDDSGDYLGKVRLIWDKAASAFDKVNSFKRHDFTNGPADLEIIRAYLDKGIPVIAEVLRPHGVPHFVVVRGYKGDDFLIRDPLNEKTDTLREGYNISDRYGSGAERNIFGIRVFLAEQENELVQPKRRLF